MHNTVEIKNRRNEQFRQLLAKMHAVPTTRLYVSELRFHKSSRTENVC